MLFEYFSGSIFLMIISEFRAVGSFHICWSLRVRLLKNPALPHFQLIFCMQSYPDNPIAFAQSTWPGLVWSPKKFSSTWKVGKGKRVTLKCSSKYKIFTLEFASALCWLIFHEQSPCSAGDCTNQSLQLMQAFFARIKHSIGLSYSHSHWWIIV